MWKPQMWAGFTLVVVSAWVVPPAANAGPGDATVPVIEPVVLEELAHDPAAFTEGFEIDGSALYEGTGLAGASQMRELDPATGTVRRDADSGPGMPAGRRRLGSVLRRRTPDPQRRHQPAAVPRSGHLRRDRRRR